VRLIAPSQTKTIRLGLNASLRYDISKDHTIRIPLPMTVAVTSRPPNSAYLRPTARRHAFPVNDPDHRCEWQCGRAPQSPVLCDPASGFG
jgi:iron complex outermembrane receptor protein